MFPRENPRNEALEEDIMVNPLAAGLTVSRFVAPISHLVDHGTQVKMGYLHQLSM
jgi:hypothetical protein